MSAKSKADDKASVSGADTEPNLDAVEKLLATAEELMKNEPGLDREAFEYLRRLRVRVRSARRAQNAHVNIPSEKYLSRQDLTEDPISFAQRVYGSLLRSGQYSRADLKRWDPSLYNAVANYISRHGQPTDFLPTKSQLVSRKLQGEKDVRAPSRTRKVAELSKEEQQQLRLYDVLRARRKRRK